MIVLSGTKQELKASSAVSKSVELVDVFLTKVNAKNVLHDVEEREVPIRLAFRVPYGIHEITSRNTLLVKSGIEVYGHVETTDAPEAPQSEEEIKIRLEVEFAAEFVIPEEPIPDEVHKVGLAAFAKFNGPYLCMPYLRQTVQSLASQMKLEITLPTLKIQSQSEDSLAAEKEKKVPRKDATKKPLKKKTLKGRRKQTTSTKKA